MPTPSSRGPRYGGNAIADANARSNAQTAYASAKNRADIKSLRNNDMQALGKGVPKSILPAGGIHPNMSEADMKAATRRIMGYQGTLPPAEHMPGPQHMPGSAGAPAALPPSKDPAQLAADAATLKEFQASDPNKTGAANVAAAAGKGTMVQTPYGKAGSTNVTQGKGATWQEQVVANHPEIGVKGSPANLAFIDAYKNAQKAQGPNPDGSAGAPVDPHAIAQQVITQLAVQNGKGAAGPGAGKTAAANTAAGVNQPAQGPNATNFVSAGGGAEPPPPSAATTTGNAIRGAGEAIASAPGKLVNNVVGGAVKAGSDFASAVTGNPAAGQAVTHYANSAIGGVNSAVDATGHLIGHAVAALTGYGGTPAQPATAPVVRAHAPGGGEQFAQAPGGGGDFTPQPAQTTAATPTTAPASPTPTAQTPIAGYPGAYKTADGASHYPPSILQKGADALRPYVGNNPAVDSPLQKGIDLVRPALGPQSKEDFAAANSAKGTQSPQNAQPNGGDLDALNQHMAPSGLGQRMDPSSTAAGAQATPGESAPTNFKAALTPVIQPYSGASSTAGASPNSTVSPPSTSASGKAGIQPYTGNATNPAAEDDETKKAAPVAAEDPDAR